MDHFTQITVASVMWVKALASPLDSETGIYSTNYRDYQKMRSISLGNSTASRPQKRSWKREILVQSNL